jgi:hypothetical protein
MKKLAFILVGCSGCLAAQTSTDSISTSFGEFVLISEEQIEVSTGYVDETSTTSDGGTAQFLEVSSGARLAPPISETTEMNMIISMMPNPTSGITEMQIQNASGSVLISVTDLLGQTIYSCTIAVDGNRTAYLPSQLWTSGSYFVNVRYNGSIITERLIVE